MIQYYEGDALDVNALIDELRYQASLLKAGEMVRPEAMLLAQAHTLDALFSNLARKSHTNSQAGYTEAACSYLKLALRAQAQTVRTIEALGELKNPKPVSFVKQANITNGPQQVNNYERAGVIGNEPNKLLDAGAQSLTGGSDTTLQAMGEILRAEVARG